MITFRQILTILILLLAVTTGTCASTIALDENSRPGLVVGGDFGFSPITGKHDSTGSKLMSGTCLSTYVGWCSKPSYFLAVQNQFLIYNLEKDHLYAQGFFGLTAHRLFKPNELSPFVIVGAGMYYFKPTADSEALVGPGGLLGIGQEMNRHVRVSVMVAAGKTDQTTHLQLSGNVGLIFY